MKNDRRLREILEPEAPRLSSEAATRIAARVREATDGRRRMPALGWAMAAVPALAIAAILFLTLPQGSNVPEFSLLDENSFVAALSEWEAGGGSLNGIFETDIEWNDLELDDEDRATFLDELENFDLEII